jgi:putative transposase
MPRVPRELIEHALNVDPKARPVKQLLRRFDEPKRKTIAAKLHSLENAGFIREIKTSTWVSNPVTVPRKNTNVCHICVNYTSLNKYCPKDPFPLPHIDQIIDSTAGSTRISFLDAYSGYNQIKLKKEDKEKKPLSTIRCLLLPSHALWPQERGSNLSKDDAKLPQKPNRLKYPRIL